MLQRTYFLKPAQILNQIWALPILLCSFCWLFLCAAQANANALNSAASHNPQTPEFMDVDDAFALQLDQSNTVVEFIWIVAPDYYLYKHKFKVIGIDHNSNNRQDLTEQLQLSKGLRQSDDYYGSVEVYRYQAIATLAKPLPYHALEVSYQGCADAGLCYPVQTRQFKLK